MTVMGIEKLDAVLDSPSFLDEQGNISPDWAIGMTVELPEAWMDEPDDVLTQALLDSDPELDLIVEQRVTLLGDGRASVDYGYYPASGELEDFDRLFTVVCGGLMFLMFNKGNRGGSEPQVVVTRPWRSSTEAQD